MKHCCSNRSDCVDVLFINQAVSYIHYVPKVVMFKLMYSF